MNKQDQGQLIRKIEKQHDVLDDYSGLWANLYVFKTGNKIGTKRFSSAEQCIPGTRNRNTGEYRTIEESMKRGSSWGNFEWKDFLFVTPIPVGNP